MTNTVQARAMWGVLACMMLAVVMTAGHAAAQERERRDRSENSDRRGNRPPVELRDPARNGGAALRNRRDIHEFGMGQRTGGQGSRVQPRQSGGAFERGRRGGDGRRGGGEFREGPRRDGPGRGGRGPGGGRERGFDDGPGHGGGDFRRNRGPGDRDAGNRNRGRDRDHGRNRGRDRDHVIDRGGPRDFAHRNRGRGHVDHRRRRGGGHYAHHRPRNDFRARHRHARDHLVIRFHRPVIRRSIVLLPSYRVHPIVVHRPRYVHAPRPNVVFVRDYGPVYTGFGYIHDVSYAWPWIGLTPAMLDIAGFMTESQLRAHEQALIDATYAEPGQLIRWYVDDSSGEVEVLRLGEDENGLPCREIRQDVIVGGERGWSTFTACQDAEGAWHAYDAY